jgi:threonine dehydratase
MTDIFSRENLEAAASYVHSVMSPTAQIHWPLLSERTGAEVWVKHENHTPIGAFKVRGGLTYMKRLVETQPDVTGVISATRGNHGQSIAIAARRHGLRPVIFAPTNNSVEKNAAMRAHGAELHLVGHDFIASREAAEKMAAEEGLHMVPSFHDWLIEGVASYALELMTGAPELDALYVPVGLGSGICGCMAVRDALGLKTQIIGVVAEKAAGYALSFGKSEPIATNSSDTFADGLAVRTPDADALGRINAGVERIVALSEEEMKASVRHFFTDTHNTAEGAGAATLAALLKEKDKMAGKRVGLILSGGNMDIDKYTAILAEGADPELAEA